MVRADHGHPTGKAGIKGHGICRYHQCEAGRSDAGGHARPAAGVFLRLSYKPEQLEFHFTGWNGSV